MHRSVAGNGSDGWHRLGVNAVMVAWLGARVTRGTRAIAALVVPAPGMHTGDPGITGLHASGY